MIINIITTWSRACLAYESQLCSKWMTHEEKKDRPTKAYIQLKCVRFIAGK